MLNCFETHFAGGSKTEAGKDRAISIGLDGLEAYQRMLRRAGEAGGTLLIDGYTGANKNSSNYTKREWRDLMQEIGRPGVVPYSCRHTFITRAIRAGVDLPVLEAQNLKICNKSVTRENSQKQIM